MVEFYKCYESFGSIDINGILIVINGKIKGMVRNMF